MNPFTFLCGVWSLGWMVAMAAQHDIVGVLVNALCGALTTKEVWRGS